MAGRRLHASPAGYSWTQVHRGTGQRQHRGCTLLRRGKQACPPPPSPKVMSTRGRVCASGSRGQQALQLSAGAAVEGQSQMRVHAACMAVPLSGDRSAARNEVKMRMWTGSRSAGCGEAGGGSGRGRGQQEASSTLAWGIDKPNQEQCMQGCRRLGCASVEGMRCRVRCRASTAVPKDESRGPRHWVAARAGHTHISRQALRESRQGAGRADVGA